MARTKEEIAAYKKEWREKNREKVLAYDKERYKNPKRRSDSIKRAAEYGKSEKRKKWKEDNKEKNREYARRHYYDTKDQLRYVKKYGITLEQYKKMYDNQSGKCKICDIPSEQLTTPLNVDHCHTTQIVRGLLCGRCNSALGKLKENKKTIENLINYLEWHIKIKQKQTNTLETTGKE